MCVKLYVFIHRRKVNVRFVNQHTLIYVHSRKVFVYVIVRPHALMVYKKKKQNKNQQNKTTKMTTTTTKQRKVSYLANFCICRTFISFATRVAKYFYKSK